MKLPNGFGSVYKLKGRRRNPWVARKTVDYKLDLEGKTCNPVYKYIGYYPTREAAMTALGNYNANPYDLKERAATLREVYELWADDTYEKLSDSQVQSYKTAWKAIAQIGDLKVKDLRLLHLQQTLDDAGKNAPSAAKIKTLYVKLFEHAVRHEFITPEKAAIAKYVRIKSGNPDKHPHRPFTKEEIGLLWSQTDGYFAPLYLVLIYTGLRISELLNLTKDNLHLDERYLYVSKSKTAAGVRTVPVAEKIVPFFERFCDTDSQYVVKGIREERLSSTVVYRPYYYEQYDHNLDHTCHDCRHTCASLLADAGVDERIIRAILGHAGQGVTERTYTHISLEAKQKAINMICP